MPSSIMLASTKRVWIVLTEALSIKWNNILRILLTPPEMIKSRYVHDLITRILDL